MCGSVQHLLFLVENSQKPARPSSVTARLMAMFELVYNTRRKLATGAAALLAFMVGYHVVFGQNGLTAYEAKRHDLRDLESQTKQLQDDNARVRSHVERLTNNPDAIEHEARETLHYTRPGEVIYTLPVERKNNDK